MKPTNPSARPLLIGLHTLYEDAAVCLERTAPGGFPEVVAALRAIGTGAAVVKEVRKREAITDANAKLGALVRPYIKHNPALGQFFIQPMLLIAESRGSDDTLDAALARKEIR